MSFNQYRYTKNIYRLFLIPCLGLSLMGFSIIGPQNNSVSQENGSGDSIFNAFYKQYQYLKNIDSLKLADSPIQSAIHRAFAIEDTALILLGLENSADLDFDRYAFSEAIDTDHQRITISSSINNVEEQSSALKHLQVIYQELNMIDSAIYYCDLEMKVNRENQRFYHLSKSYSRMHDLLRWSLGGESEKSFILENLMDSALTIAIRSNNRTLIAETLISKGMNIHNYDHNLGLSYINRAIDTLRHDEEVNPLLALGLYQRSIVYYDNEQYSLAEADLNSCLALVTSDSRVDYIKDGIYGQLGRLYHKTGEYRKAIDNMNIAYQLALLDKNSGFFGIYTTLAMLYNETGQKDSCIYFLSRHINGLYDKFDRNSTRQIAISGARFQISEHQNRIEELNNQNQKKEIRNTLQRRFIVLLIFSILLISILTVVIYKQYLKTRQAFRSIQNKNGKIARQEEEITNLKEQKLKELLDRFEQDMDLLDKLMKVDKIFLNADLSLTKVANLLKINHSYLSSIINRHFGCSFTHYLNKYRIKEAIRLLDAGDHEKYSIDAISIMVGYKSKSAFYRAFRQQKNCTPTEYLSRKKKV